MRKFLAAVALLAILTMVLPSLIVQTYNHFRPARVEEQGTQVRLYVQEEKKIISLPLEDYLIGVVAAEMPADFPEEALKAQAVIARTFTMQRLAPGGIANPVHPGADLDDDPLHGQAWIDGNAMRKRWQNLTYYRNYFKIKWAVDSTSGKVITYDGQLISPVFFASCGGKATENAADVWKASAPYLKSAANPYEPEPYPSKQTTFTLSQLDQLLAIPRQALPVSTGAREKMISVTDRTDTGRPKDIKIAGRKFSAEILRIALGLPSSRISWQIKGDKITFTTIGDGSGVGFCQDGAGGYAQHGQNYRQILTHYYTGVKITDMNM